MIEHLYIHIPFCKKKCLYCDFNSFDNKTNLISEYFEALINERKTWEFENLKTIYIGGGTPSFVDEKYIEQLLSSLPNAEEITIEVNPCTVTKEKLHGYKKAGINRVSIGLQTTNNNILKEIGRISSFENFEKAYSLIRESGFENVSVDLMFGLPKQTLDDLKESVEYLIKINPEHISCYSLILHENIFEDLPDESTEREMYYYIKDALKSAGYTHYEISNFAKEGFESKHNLAYWSQKEYVGLGAGASSYVDKTRYTNECELDEYILKIKSEVNINNIEEIQDEEAKIREYMILRLRLLAGVNINQTNEKFGIDVMKKFEKEIHKLMKMQLIEIIESVESKTIKLSAKGLDFANVVWREFV